MKTGDLIFLAAAALVIVGCTSERSRADAQVRELCRKDGGLYVYEEVTLPDDKFNEFGEVRVLSKDLMKQGDEFFYEDASTTLREGNPEVWRFHYKLYRRSDLKLLGEAVSYARGGGDLLPPQSSFICPENVDIKYLNHRVFQRVK